MFETACQDIRYGFRLLRQSPLFTLTAALSLAIGIGANTTIFSVASGLLLRPQPGVADPGRLVDIGRTQNGKDFDNSSYRITATSARASRRCPTSTPSGSMPSPWAWAARTARNGSTAPSSARTTSPSSALARIPAGCSWMPTTKARRAVTGDGASATSSGSGASAATPGSSARRFRSTAIPSPSSASPRRASTGRRS